VLASRVLTDVPPPAGSREVDWAKLIDLTVVVLKVVVLVFGCLALEPPRALRKLRRPGPLVRWKLRSTLRKILAREGRLDLLEPFYEGLLKVGKPLTVDDLRRLLGEVAADESVAGRAAAYGIDV
jgi:hypothetical protein